MTRPPATRSAWVLAAIFGLIAILACGAVISCGVRMDQAEQEREARLAD